MFVELLLVVVVACLLVCSRVQLLLAAVVGGAVVESPHMLQHCSTIDGGVGEALEVHNPLFHVCLMLSAVALIVLVWPLLISLCVGVGCRLLFCGVVVVSCMIEPMLLFVLLFVVLSLSGHPREM